MRTTVAINMAEDGFRKAYGDWLNDPVTKRIMEQSMRVTRTRGLASTDPNAALYAHGMSVGQTLQHDFLFRQLELYEADKLAKLQEEVLKSPGFAAERLLEEMAALDRVVHGEEHVDE